jgi:hypothetical protein
MRYGAARGLPPGRQVVPIYLMDWEARANDPACLGCRGRPAAGRKIAIRSPSSVVQGKNDREAPRVRNRAKWSNLTDRRPSRKVGRVALVDRPYVPQSMTMNSAPGRVVSWAARMPGG